jgi:hypothetical protein
MSERLVWSARWVPLNSWASSQILVPRCANHNGLATMHLQYVNCPLFLTTYIQRNPYSVESVQMSNWMVDVSTKAISTWTSKNNSFYQYKHLRCLCKVCIEVATIDWSQVPHMGTQHNKNMTTSHFDSQIQHILIIFNLYGSCVDA